MLRLLGRGGMGAVYEARDLELDRIVAVKVIGDDFARRPDAADRFRREARAAASFTHPNVVTVHDFGLADGAPYLVMERLVGATLRERLRASGRLAGAEAVHVLRGAAAGIDEAHRVGLIHRDLKPENIFLPDGSGVAAKLLDFGIARVVAVPSGASTATGTASGVLIGSVAYMAPEQIQGGTPASAWDIWALGVTAYECLTGARPFSEGAALTSAAAILSGRWTPVWEHLPGASGALQTFFVSAFSLDPAERPKTASAAVESLAECLRV